MSRSALRLPASDRVEQFAWQKNGGGRTGVEPFALLPINATSRSQEPASHELRLPTVNVDRIAAIERQAYADGYAAGEQAARADVSRDTAALLDRLAASIAEVGMLRVDVMRRADQDLVRLALAMAERIVRFRLRVDTRLLLLMAKLAAERLGENVTATVALNPADYETLPASRDLAGTLEVVPDPAVARGGCLIRSDTGTIDAGVDAQVRELASVLLGTDQHFDELAAYASDSR